MLPLLRTAVRRPHPSLRPLFRQLRPKSTITHHAASPDATREVPTPLVLVSASKWSGEQTSMSAFVKHFTQHGWNVACIDLDPEQGGERDVSACKTSVEVLSRLEGELAAQMRQANTGGGGSPFPPMLVANGLASLVAETYVSSHPLSAMALLDPPLTPEVAHQAHTDKLPTPLEPFTYEVRFPCLVAWSADRAKQLAFFEVHRIEEAREDEADEALDRYVWDVENAEADVEGAGPDQLRKWAEDSGIGVSNAQALESDEDEEDVEESDESQEDEGESDDEVDDEKDDKTKKPYTPPTPPEWFVAGKYIRNPERAAKKYPLFLDESHLREAFIRGSGPGGQAINKLATCVQLTHLPTGMQVRSQETRSRVQNRDIARRRLSRELERIVFGERDSVLGREASKGRKKEQKKSQKRKRREKFQRIRENMKDKFWKASEDEISAKT